MVWVTVLLDCPFVVTWWQLRYILFLPRYLQDLQRVKSENASFLKNFSDVSLYAPDAASRI
jgi:hypothetical protein